MPVITWQNVQAPDFSSAQQGLRNASDLLGRAAESGMGITKELASQEAAKKAADQQYMNQLLTQQMLTPQTPEAYAAQQAQGMGKLADGRQVPLQNISPEMMLRMDARKGELLARQDAALSRGELALTRERQHTQDAAQDRLAPIFAKYSSMAIHSPARAEALLAAEAQSLGVSLPAMKDVMESLRKQAHFVDPASQAAAGKIRMDMALQNQLNAAIGQSRKLGDDPVAQRKFLESLPDDVAAALPVAVVKTGLYPSYNEEVASPKATLGIAGPGPITDESQKVDTHMRKYTENVEQETRAMPEPAKVLAQYYDSKLGLPEVAANIAKRIGPKANIGEINERLTVLNEKAGGKLPPEALGHILETGTSEDSIFSVSNYSPDTDENEGKQNTMLDKFLDADLNVQQSRQKTQNLAKKAALHKQYNENRNRINRMEQGAVAGVSTAKLDALLAENARLAKAIEESDDSALPLDLTKSLIEDSNPKGKKSATKKYVR
jgi:hypothetical protein